MTFEEIITGINQSECKQELYDHLDLTKQALDNGECDYDLECWELISRASKSKLMHFNQKLG